MIRRRELKKPLRCCCEPDIELLLFCRWSRICRERAGVADKLEWAPECGMQLRFGIERHALRRAERLRLRSAGAQAMIHMLHQPNCRGIGDAPEADDQRPCAGVKHAAPKPN